MSKPNDGELEKQIRRSADEAFQYGGSGVSLSRDVMKLVATERLRAQREELDRKISTHVDQLSSADYERGLQDALDQIDAHIKQRKAAIDQALATAAPTQSAPPPSPPTA